MKKKKNSKELAIPQVLQLTEMVAVSRPDTINLLVQKAMDAVCPNEERMGFSWGSDIQKSLADNPSLLNLICALGPRDIAEVMLISQLVVLHLKGMKSFHNDNNEIGMEFLKLSQETFELLNRYRGKATSQNINVNYNVISEKTQINTKICSGVTEKSDEPHDRS
jgi:hypothetical protein